MSQSEGHNQDPSLLKPEPRVLSTLNEDGSRRWLRPRVSTGSFHTWRRVVGLTLIAIFAGLPYFRIGGLPPILLDLPQRRFTFFGTTFLPTETLLLALLFLGLFILVFFVTALFGRVWCGWGCPQTVYMEFVFRPLERFFDGKAYRSGGRVKVNPLRRVAKYITYLVLCLGLAHIFLAYFVPTDELFTWMRQSPTEHPKAFLIVFAVTGLMMLDFCLLREQICTLMCPYGRLQSVLLDRDSLTVSYDRQRGDPRGKARRGSSRQGSPRQGTAATEATSQLGDCVDCHLCVLTCPTGIDIRDGVQMECVGCAQCIDACDTVMARINRPLGLIRYSSQNAIEKKTGHLLRIRTAIYPILLVIVASAFVMALISRTPFDVTMLRARNTPYQVLESGEIESRLLIKITNRSEQSRLFAVNVPGDMQMSCPELPVTLAEGASAQLTLRIVAPSDAFYRGRADLTVVVTDDLGDRVDRDAHVIGPLFTKAGGSS